MSDRKHYANYILFSKGYYDNIPEGHYWDALLHLAAEYNGMELKFQRLSYVYSHTMDAVKHFLPNLSVEKYNEQVLFTARFCEKNNLTLIQTLIRTNMYFLSDLSADDVGGNWDWLDKNNLIKFEFKPKGKDDE